MFVNEEYIWTSDRKEKKKLILRHTCLLEKQVEFESFGGNLLESNNLF